MENYEYIEVACEKGGINFLASNRPNAPAAVRAMLCGPRVLEVVTHSGGSSRALWVLSGAWRSMILARARQEPHWSKDES